MPRIVDREREHLGASDAAVTRLRRRLLEIVREFEQTGKALGLDRERTP